MVVATTPNYRRQASQNLGKYKSGRKDYYYDNGPKHCSPDESRRGACALRCTAFLLLYLSCGPIDRHASRGPEVVVRELGVAPSRLVEEGGKGREQPGELRLQRRHVRRLGTRAVKLDHLEQVGQKQARHPPLQPRLLVHARRPLRRGEGLGHPRRAADLARNVEPAAARGRRRARQAGAREPPHVSHAGEVDEAVGRQRERELALEDGRARVALPWRGATVSK